MSTAKASGTADNNPVVTANISPAVMKGVGGTSGSGAALGNEGAGVVVQAGRLRQPKR
jgi:hypothetical protein